MKNYIAAIVAVAAVLCNSAFAADQNLCANHANFVLLVGNARDAGHTEDEVTTRVTKSAEHSPVAGDLPQMIQVIHLVFTVKNKSPDALADEFYQACMGAKES